MPLVAQIFAGIAATVHVLFFYLESFVFTKNGTYKSFGLTTQDEAEIVKPMALNQGFYNLFLAIGVIVGLVFSVVGSDGAWTAYVPLDEDPSIPLRFQILPWAEPMVVFGCACMAAAAIVLLISSRGKLLRGVLIQGVAPAVALIAIAVG